MKKINILFTLIISLFFFSTQVKAATKDINVNLSDEDFSYINDEFLNFRSKVIDYVSNSDSKKYYIIIYNISKNRYEALIFSGEISEKYLRSMDYSSGRAFLINIPVSYGVYIEENNILIYTNSNSSSFMKAIFSENSISYYNFLDTNINDIFVQTSSILIYSNIEINVRDYYLKIEDTTDIPTLYDIYISADIGTKFDSHEDEKNMLLNFYNLVIEKISYITGVFTSNHIFLSILVIIVFVIAIEFLWRLL